MPGDAPDVMRDYDLATLGYEETEYVVEGTALSYELAGPRGPDGRWAVTAGPEALMPLPSRWDAVPSPRLSARYLASDDVAVKGSAGWYVRLPTLIELFGNHGFVVGSPTLRPERGPSGELGVVWAPARGWQSAAIDRVLVEADAFATHPRDTIAMITTAGFVARAENVGRVLTYGGELVASARLWRTLTMTASYTRLDSRQQNSDPDRDGKPLPRTPTDQLAARVDAQHALAGHALAGWADATYQAESFLDPASLGVVPARLLFGAGARLELAARVGVSLAVSNLTDERIVQLPLVPPPSPTFTTTPAALTDVAGYPLPGRSFYLTLDWSH